jgi:hypothetical protein
MGSGGFWWVLVGSGRFWYEIRPRCEDSYTGKSWTTVSPTISQLGSLGKNILFFHSPLILQWSPAILKLENFLFLAIPSVYYLVLKPRGN